MSNISNKARRLVVFHPSPFMVQEVSNLIESIAPSSTWSNVIVEDLLQRASKGISDKVVSATKAALSTIDGSDFPIVLCTCSTLGGLSEKLGKEIGLEVVRIDRPMSEKAVMTGKEIGVVAAVRSTIQPTFQLLQEVARKQGKEISLSEVFVDGAWELKESGESDGYLRQVEQKIRDSYRPFDVLVLAQGSMAIVAERCKDLPVPIFSSPRLGVEAVLRQARKH